MIVLVECYKLPLFHELMNFRLVFSALPSSVLCMVVVYHAERAHWLFFVTFLATLCTIFSWCLHMRIVYAAQLNVLSKVSLDISWVVTLAIGFLVSVLYLSDKLDLITASDLGGCSHASNDNLQMPVFVPPVNAWYCAPWDSETSFPVQRVPANSVPMKLSCTDTYVGSFGTSIDPHLFDCPSGCLSPDVQQSGAAIAIIGCGVYAVDTPVCLGAIHAGVLTDAGGRATVYGRLGVPRFKSCNRNSLVSEERVVVETGSIVSVSQPSISGSSGFRRLGAGPVVIASDGRQLPQAFHFNNQAETREFLWLKQYEISGPSMESPSAEDSEEEPKPWTQIAATVSMRMAGLELNDETVHLGTPAPQALFVQPRPGQVFDVRPPQCIVQETGVLCAGAGAAAIQLDFCRPEMHTCGSP